MPDENGTPEPEARRSRGLTTYVALVQDASGFKTELDEKPQARSPEAAREMIESDVPDDCEIVTLIPASSFHTFIRARSWKKV